MTTEQYMALALAEMRKATWPPEKWCAAIQEGYPPGHEYDWMATHNYKAQQALWQAAHPNPEPVPPPPAPSPHNFFAGKGIFTTSEPAAASHPCDWYAVQADPEGNAGVANTNGRRCFWMARPTLEMVTHANRNSIPFIAQAENLDELRVALALGPSITVPKALVGNPTSWTDPKAWADAVSQGWELILEWYWNAQPGYTQPDAANYPYFTNVCFGIYSEGEPGGDGYVPQSKSVADYRAVWHGSFSVWKGEAMTPADWVAFEA